MSCPCSPELKDGLLRAIYEGALSLRFLPIASLGVGIRRVKAEVAWQHPDFGRLESAAIRRIARSSGVTAVIDAWMLTETSALSLAWQSEPAMSQVKLVIPLSRAAALSTAGRERVLPVQSDAPLLSSGLEFEIDRCAVSIASALDRDLFSRLRAMGSGLVLRGDPRDGETPSSAEDIPWRALQIDVSEVAESTQLREVSRRCERVVEAARCSNLEVIATGVETFDMLHVAADAGVDAVQGSITGGAMSLGELEDYMAPGIVGSIVDLQASITAMQSPA